MQELIAHAYAAIGAGREGRIPNRPEERAYRKDAAYERLTKMRYADRDGFLRFCRTASAVVLKFPEDPSATALAAYCAALS